MSSSMRRTTWGRGIASGILLLVSQGCAAVPLPFFGAGPPLLEDAGVVTTRSPMDQIHWGIAVARVDSVQVEDAAGEGWERTLEMLAEESAHRKFVPASNMKIPATAAALSVLGPEHRFETAFWATAERDGEYLRGDLILPADGDPTLGKPFHESGEAALTALADSLVASGVRVVEGALVIDASAWDSVGVPGSWTVGSVEQPYGASGGAFTVDAGELWLEARGDFEPGHPAQVRWSPLGELDFVQNQVVTAEEPEGLRAAFRPESRRMVLSGAVRPGSVDSIRVAARDPVRQAAAVLHRVLLDRGVEIHFGLHILWDEGEELGGGCVSGAIPECDESWKIAGLTSPPLSEIVEVILKRSQNWMSEQVVRTLGREAGGTASWEDGLAAISRYLLEDVEVDPLDFLLRDGSGLSSHNLLTPRAIIAVLHHMDTSGFGELYRDALATPGERDSTLEERLLELEGRIRAKTGTLTNANAISGYLVRDDGTELVFSVLTNGTGLPADLVREAMDEVVRTLAGSD